MNGKFHLQNINAFLFGWFNLSRTANSNCIFIQNDCIFYILILYILFINISSALIKYVNFNNFLVELKNYCFRNIFVKLELYSIIFVSVEEFIVIINESAEKERKHQREWSLINKRPILPLLRYLSFDNFYTIFI